jgi:hypothetical protein
VQGVTGSADKMFTRARRGGDKVAAGSPAHTAVTIKYRTKRSANFVLHSAAKAVPAHDVLDRETTVCCHILSPRSPLIDNGLAALHDPLDVANCGNVFQRVAVKRDQISECPRGDDAKFL